MPIPGASAVLAAVAGSGVAGPRWSFEGFLPRSGRERRDRLARIAADERGTVLFEAPGRLAATLRDLAAACGARAGRRPSAASSRSSTSRSRAGRSASSGRDGRRRDDPGRGEVVIVVGWGSAPAADPEAATTALEAARARVDALVAAGTARGDAAKQVSAETGLPRRALYAATPEA